MYSVSVIVYVMIECLTFYCSFITDTVSDERLSQAVDVVSGYLIIA